MRIKVKIMLVAFMILGIAISMLNFLPEKLDAAIIGMGNWEYFEDGPPECMGNGNECSPGMPLSK